MLDIFSQSTPQTETGTIEENMLDGYYRVRLGGQIITAKDQSGVQITIGSIVSVSSTSWGNFIISAAGRNAGDIQRVIIRG